MSNPTFNKYKSTTIYGALKVRDLTNPSGTTIVESASTDLSGNFLSQGDSIFTKKVVCNALLADINANNILTTKEYVDSVVSTSGSVTLSGTNAFTSTNSFNNFFPTSNLPTSTTITTDSIVNKGMLDTIYQTIANMTNYLTTTTASSTYQTIANMTNYLTTMTASNTYQTIANMTNYLTTTTASSTYQTISGMSSYLTTAIASTTYSTKANEVKTNTANAFTSTNTFNTNLPTSTLTPTTNTQLTTKAYVDSVAGGVGVATLAGTQSFTGTNTFLNNNIVSKTSLAKGAFITINPYKVKVDDDNYVSNNSNINIERNLLTITNGSITQTGTTTNTMNSLKVNCLSTPITLFSNTNSVNLSTTKMTHYYRFSRQNMAQGSTFVITLSNNNITDDGQVVNLYIFLNNNYYTININAGTGSTIEGGNYSNFIEANNYLNYKMLYVKASTQWIFIR